MRDADKLAMAVLEDNSIGLIDEGCPGLWRDAVVLSRAVLERGQRIKELEAGIEAHSAGVRALLHKTVARLKAVEEEVDRLRKEAARTKTFFLRS